MLYRARYLLPMIGPPLVDAALRVENGLITALGKAGDLPALPGEAVWSGPQHVLLPGLINTHAHLELHDLRGRLGQGLGFAAWVKALRAATATFTEADYTRACRLGALECLRYGTTTVVDIGNTGATPAAVADLPMRVFACLEVLGLDPSLATARMQAAEARWAATPDGLGSQLLTKLLVPHAPYSVSLPLFAALRDHAEGKGEPVPDGGANRQPPNERKPHLFTVHAGESREEEMLFDRASGELQDFCTAIYPGAPRHQRMTALAYLHQHNLLPRRALVVHANGRSCEEAGYLAALQATISHCPQSHAFFGHPPFAADVFRDAGVPITLGTDSLASGTSLSLFDAMRDFALSNPGWSSESILRMVTCDAGAALGLEGGLGRLAVGAKADFIAVRASTDLSLPQPGETRPNPPHPDWTSLFDAVVRETTEVELVVVAGEQVLT
jgi:aminodeoxyfutalosine deaminase